jgi:hypothetical protein
MHDFVLLAGSGTVPEFYCVGNDSRVTLWQIQRKRDRAARE